MRSIEKIRKEKPINELLDFSLIIIDKPTGPTSFEVDLLVQNMLGAKKTGHCGTLDPAVTGVLPITLNRACRIASYFKDQEKTYVGIMKLHTEVSDDVLEKAITRFTGTIKQLPPVRSQVKRVERERAVHTFKILERAGSEVLFETRVQAGTYIRKLIHDIGQEIGGAHMLELRRTKASIFGESTVITLYDLQNAVKEYRAGNEQPLRKILVPGEILTTFLPTVKVKESYIEQCLKGSPLFAHMISGKPAAEGTFCVISKDKFIGCYTRVNKNTIIGMPAFVAT